MPDKSEDKKHSLFFKLVIGFISIVLLVLMFPKGESIEFEVSEGAIWLHDDLIAPFSFAIKKSEEAYRKEVSQAEKSVYPVFLNKTEVIKQSIDSLKAYTDFLTNALDHSIDSGPEQIANPTFLSSASFSTFSQIRVRERNLLKTDGLALYNFNQKLTEALEGLYKKGIINFETGEQKKDSIAVRTGNVDKIEPITQFLTPTQAKNELTREIHKLDFNNQVEKALIEYGTHFLFPNIVFSENLTKEEIDQAKSNVSKYTGVIVNENERIVAKHDRITKDIKLKLESYKEAKGEIIGEESMFLQLVGKFIHIALFFALLTIYLFLFRKKIFYDNQKIILITIILLFVSFVTFLINQVVVQAPVHYLIFIPAASMLFTIIFDSRVGFYMTVILTLITGALRGNDYTFMATNFIAGGISVYTVRDIKNRSQIFRSFLFILGGYLLAIIAFGLERFAPWGNMLIEFAFAASNALISPVLTYGLLIFFERFFKITTDLTLLELSNFDRPLLRELARKAPGTFNHSMTMGTIAEAAAEKIGANSLLARVGAYYHDIGKTITPQNFVENQLNNQNIHENLKPEESVQLISTHVKEGIQMAIDHDLPKEIIDFIPMHHGTMVMSYFYERAKKLYGEENVSVNDYRYPGPKPNTKETAIIMLADGCESAVRSIDEPDPQKVENVIENIFKSRIEDKQLENTPITFDDITKMKESFLNILIGQHHRRIKYPKQEDVEKGTDKENKK